MTGEIHLTHEVLDRLIRGELSADERQVLFEHLENSGSCERCDEAANDLDDERFVMIVGRVARLQLRALRRRVEAGDPAATAELNELRFQTVMRVVR